MCGFTLSARYWQALFSTLLRIADTEQLKNIRGALPLLIIGGGDDPVSAGHGLHKLQYRLQRAQLKKVELLVYPQARHEVFNETNREQVTGDLLNWIMTTLSLHRRGTHADENA